MPAWTHPSPLATLCSANERGSVMHTTPYGHGAVYDPDALRTLGTVFDNAWASIAVNFDARSSRAGPTEARDQ